MDTLVTIEIIFSIVLTMAGTFLMVARFKLFSKQNLNTIQVMFLSHILAQLIPAVTLIFDPHLPSAETFLLHNAVATVLIPLGGILADLMFPKMSMVAFYRKPVADSRADRQMFLNFYILYFAFCAFIFVTYVIQVPTIPIADLLFSLEDAAAQKLARRDATTQGLIYGIALRFFMPALFVLSIIGHGYFQVRSVRNLMVIGATMAVLYNAWPGSKTPVAVLFLLTLIILILRDREQKPGASPGPTKRSLRRRILGGFFTLMVIGYPLLIYMFKPVGNLGLWFVFQQIFQRIFFKPALNSYYAFEMFSNRSYTLFTDIKKWAQLTGQEYYNLSIEVSFFKGFDIISNSPPAAIGNFYAQGGSVAVIAGVLIAAFMFRFTENMLRISSPKTPLTITCFGILIFGAFRFSWASFHTLIMAELFVPMLLIYGIFHFSQRFRSRRVLAISGKETLPW